MMRVWRLGFSRGLPASIHCSCPLAPSAMVKLLSPLPPPAPPPKAATQAGKPPQVAIGKVPPKKSIAATGGSFMRARVVDVEYIGDVTPRRGPSEPPIELGPGR